MKINYSQEVQAALNGCKPVLALESTIIAHGMPYPKNLEFAHQAESLCRNQGVVPATVAIINGQVYVGLEKNQIELISKDVLVKKISRRELGFALSRKLHGAVTVSATMHIAHSAGIRVFSTGGIGGVHRGVENTLDISEDLSALGSIPMIVVSAGAKAILDIGRTLEYMETSGVTVVGYKTNEFPSFYSRHSGFQGIYQVDSAESIANIHQKNLECGLLSALLVANPIQEKDEIPAQEIEAIITSACSKALENNISGKELTPYLLAEIVRKTEGRSLDSNRALALNNVALGAEISLKVH
jgi:pseudouridine-5'-phosphate glycosidase